MKPEKLDVIFLTKVQMMRLRGMVRIVPVMSVEFKTTSHAPREHLHLSHMIFDMDGTLVENMELIIRSVNFAVKDIVGKEFNRKELYSYFGPTLEQIIIELVPSGEAENAVRNYHAYYREHFKELAKVHEGIHALLRYLKDAGIETAIYTGSDARMTKTTLELTGLQDQFPVVVTADDVKKQKPDPEGLIRTIDLMHGKPETALYLGDAVRDVTAAKSASMLSAAALWGFADPARLRGSDPDFVFESPLDALRQLKDS